MITSRYVQRSSKQKGDTNENFQDGLIPQVQLYLCEYRRSSQWVGRQRGLERARQRCPCTKAKIEHGQLGVCSNWLGALTPGALVCNRLHLLNNFVKSDGCLITFPAMLVAYCGRGKAAADVVGHRHKTLKTAQLLIRSHFHLVS